MKEGIEWWNTLIQHLAISGGTKGGLGRMSQAVIEGFVEELLTKQHKINISVSCDLPKFLGFWKSHSQIENLKT